MFEHSDPSIRARVTLKWEWRKLEECRTSEYTPKSRLWTVLFSPNRAKPKLVCGKLPQLANLVPRAFSGLVEALGTRLAARVRLPA